MYNLTPEGMLATVGMMSLSKVIHELGHAFAASHYGCRVPAMGVALLLGMPVLWTDVTDAALESEAPTYKHPHKNWRLKQGAMPHWYKARNGVRTRALSGAARVARFRPPRAR